MSHYHPVSYETEARIRQGEKWEQARRARQAHAARAARRPSSGGTSIIGRVSALLAAAARTLQPATPERKAC